MSAIRLARAATDRSGSTSICAPSQVSFRANNCFGEPQTVFLNILVDWNQDGEFDSGDLVRAFQSGNYVNANELAAAVDWLFAHDNRAKRNRAFMA